MVASSSTDFVGAWGAALGGEAFRGGRWAAAEAIRLAAQRTGSSLREKQRIGMSLACQPGFGPCAEGCRQTADMLGTTPVQCAGSWVQLHQDHAGLQVLDRGDRGMHGPPTRMCESLSIESRGIIPTGPSE
jgi:hypothetical protein